MNTFGKNSYDSIYGLESEFISFFAIEYEYNSLWEIWTSAQQRSDQHKYQAGIQSQASPTLISIYILDQDKDWDFPQLNLGVRNKNKEKFCRIFH